MITQKVTAVANVAAQLVPFDSSRAGTSVQNPLSAPIYVSRNPLVPLTSESLYIPPANSSGVVGEYVFDGPSYEDWYYKTTVSGDFGLQTW